MTSTRLLRHLQLALLLYGVFFSLAGDAHQHATVEPPIPFEAAAVSGDGHSFVVSWRADHIQHIRILAGTDPDHIGRDRLVGEGMGLGQANVSDLPSAPRWYFELLPDRGEPLVIADRFLHLTTAANFRDGGGYRTEDGRWVRMGLVYRSNGLEHLTDEELARIERLHIKLVCDLRTAEEIRRGPDRVPEGAVDISADVLSDDADLMHAIIAGGGASQGGAGAANGPSTASGAGTPGGGAALAPLPSREGLEERIYRDFVRLPSAQKAYQALFERLADPTQLPTVFHCTAGKDRTGWAQAVFLTILGVPRPTVVEDYVLTNQYLRGAALNSVSQSVGGVAASQIVANPAALDAAFDQVMREYGSFDRYLHQGLHLNDATLAALRKNFLAG
jgi:protein-tyrosine phosphatase